MAKKQKNPKLTHDTPSIETSHPSDSFGTLFRSLREDAGLSLDKLAELTKISKQYLLYLENEEFSKLPPAVYSRGFIIRCARIFNDHGNEGIAKLLHLYASKTHENREIREGVTQKRAGFLRFFIGPQQLVIFAIGLFFLAVFLFLGARVTSFFFKPVIEVQEPAAENTVVNFATIEVGGKVLHASTLTLNGEELYIEGNGAFRKEIELQEGVNRIVLEGRNMFGRTAEVAKRVVYIKND